MPDLLGEHGLFSHNQSTNIFTFVTTLLIGSVGDLATIEPVQEFSGAAFMEEGYGLIV